MKIRDSGYTLIEILISLSIVSIMVALTAPSLAGLVESKRLESRVADLIVTMLLARSEAVTRSSRVSICKISPSVSTTVCNNSVGWDSGWIVFVDDVTANGSRDGGETILQTYLGMGGDFTVTVVNFTNFISYRPSGSSTINGEISICANVINEATSIVVYATGRPRSIDSTC